MHFVLPFVILIFCSSGSFLLVGTSNNGEGFRRNNNREEHTFEHTFRCMFCFLGDQERIIRISFYTQHHPFPSGHKLRSKVIFLYSVILRRAAPV